MTEANRENLSASLDGQLSTEELRFLLRRFETDASLPEAWSRYHIVGEALRRDLSPLASAGFADRVMLAIKQDAVMTPRRRRHWLRWSAGGAIAASVAVAALLVTQPAGREQDGGRRAFQVAANNAAPSVVPQRTVNHGDVAVVSTPAWLSNYNSLPSQLSQRASATFESGQGPLFYSHSDRPVAQPLSSYRVINRDTNSYYLLMRPEAAASQPQARAVRQ